jgi:hypothetical protein
VSRVVFYKRRQREDRQWDFTHVDIAVKPSRQVGLAEKTKRTLPIWDGFKLRFVQRKRVTVLLPALELRDIAVSRTREEVFGTCAEY